MKSIRSFFIIIFLLNSCSNDESRFLINETGEYWELREVNFNNVQNYERPFTHLVFKKNHEYQLFSNKKTSFDSLPSDAIINEEWFWNENQELNMSGFRKLKVVKLDKDTLEFFSDRIQYLFVKVSDSEISGVLR
ncbi:hypothetical protein [Fluviicola taffensis]|uniref:hypothetical protein n=1 Tax=Fluviicola taffensis TaxID=191579 RepID=UPI003137CF4A